jgi:hypothetical protein
MEIKLFPLIKKSSSYKIIVTSALENKIRFLCEKLPTKEYSGTLFYKISGTFENNDLVVEAVDFFLQDIGVSAYTEFKNDVNLASYIVEHDLLDCYMGLMHSHDVMPTFFSGTDTSTLQSEGSEANHFVSLIVNNAGEYSAAITRKVHQKGEGKYKCDYNSFENVNKTFDGEDYIVENKIVEYFDLTIEKQEASKAEESELNERYEFLLKSNTSFLNSTKTPSEFSKPATKITGFDEDFVTPDYTQWFENYQKKYGRKQLSIWEYDEIPITKTLANISQALIKSQVSQIITGNIFSSYNTKLDLDKWGINMAKAYDTRFAGKDGWDNFIVYADSLVEFLAGEAVPTSYLDPYSESTYYKTEAWVGAVIRELKKYKSNKYMNYYIKSIKRWLTM